MLGVFAALASGLAAAPPGAWRGELIMTGAVLCMSFYSVWSRPFMVRSSALGFLTVGMGAGAAALLALLLVGEPITPNLVIGLVAVFAGIWIATTENAKA